MVSGKFIYALAMSLLAVAQFTDVRPAGAVSVPPVQRTVLPNSLTLLVVEEHSLPFVIFEVLVDAGSRRDPPGKEGLARLTALGLLLGTPKQPRSVLNESVDFLGAELEATADRDYTVIRLQILKKNLDLGFGLLMEALTDPVFPESEIRAEIQRTLGRIRSVDEQPARFAEKAFRQALFPISPYGHPPEGTLESVASLTREQVVGFYRSFYKPNSVILTIVGDITPLEVKERIMPTLLAWPAGTLPKTTLEPTYAEGPRVVRLDRKIAQANIVMGNFGLRRDDPEYYAAQVMNYILGGGSFESYLMEEIRIKRGLAYAVESFFLAEKYQGSFQVMLQTKNASAAEAIRVAEQQMDRMRTSAVSDRDLALAKSYLTGSFPLRIDSQSKLARFFSAVEYYGLGLDYPEKYPRLINAVTGKDVHAVANRYLHPHDAILVIVADLEEAAVPAAPEGGKDRAVSPDRSHRAD